ncbi:MAG: hypothetical protein QXL97_01730, partial [Candidatus Aenigmatarchaeota archaeon]
PIKDIKDNDRGGNCPYARSIKNINKILTESFLRFKFDFYEEFDDYEEILEEESPSSVINCVVCKEPLFLTPPKSDINDAILEKIIELLKKRKTDEKYIERLKELKGKPICRYDLFKLIEKIFSNDKDLKGFFEKIASYYDFDRTEKY